MTGLASAPSRIRIKTAVDTASIRLSRSLRWSDVLAALQWDETRSTGPAASRQTTSDCSRRRLGWPKR